MEEKLENIGEQPVVQNAETLTVEEQQNNDSLASENGSPYGKFKNAESLLKAYESLEKEFTKKCQQLKEFESKNCDNLEITKPQYETDSWEEDVKSFFDQYPNAKPFVNEISNVLLGDKELASKPNSLANAWAKILITNFKPLNELANDDEFLNEHIYNSEKVKKVVINDYLKNVLDKKSPILISGETSGTFASPKNKPRSINDAGKMAEALFKI